MLPDPGIFTPSITNFFDDLEYCCNDIIQVRGPVVIASEVTLVFIYPFMLSIT